MGSPKCQMPTTEVKNEGFRKEGGRLRVGCCRDGMNEDSRGAAFVPSVSHSQTPERPCMAFILTPSPTHRCSGSCTQLPRPLSQSPFLFLPGTQALLEPLQRGCYFSHNFCTSRPGGSLGAPLTPVTTSRPFPCHPKTSQR